VPSEGREPEIQVLDKLKQRFPLLMVDRVLSWEKGGLLKAVKNISANEIHFLGHFPGNPVFPGVLTIECFAQAAAILVRLTEEAEGTATEGLFDVLGAVLDFRFMKPIVPGDRLETHVRITKTAGSNRIVEGKCLVAGEEAASGKLMFGKISAP
jgi:3-hydroxyacyl-[acyl-carrier-protein] dehydratase